MEFLTSDWFMYVVMGVVGLSIICGFVAAAENAGFEPGEVWYLFKKVILFCLSIILIPFVILFKRDQ